MPWVRIDDHFDEHRKVDSMSDGAFRAFVESLCFSNRSLLDGKFEKASAHKRWPRKAIRELVQRNLWDETPDGYAIHDYQDYQLNSEQILAERAAARERMKTLRGQRKKTPSPSKTPERSGEQQGEHHPEVPAKFERSSTTPTPTPRGSKEPPQSARTRGGGGVPAAGELGEAGSDWTRVMRRGDDMRSGTADQGEVEELRAVFDRHRGTDCMGRHIDQADAAYGQAVKAGRIRGNPWSWWRAVLTGEVTKCNDGGRGAGTGARLRPPHMPDWDPADLAVVDERDLPQPVERAQ